MALAITGKPNTSAPDSDYPFGNIKDNPGDGSGTPVNKLVYADFHQFFAKLMDNAGITANGLPDNAYSGFQLFESLITSGNKNFVTDIITGLIGAYTTNDLIVLWGCLISPTIPGSSTISQGAIFYNGAIYKVPAATVVTSGSQTLVFQIDSSQQPNVIYLTSGLTGTGIANYNGATVKSFYNIIEEPDWTSASITSGMLHPGVGSFSSLDPLSVFVYQKRKKSIYISFWIKLIPTSITFIDIDLPSGISYNIPGAAQNGVFDTGCEFVSNVRNPFPIQSGIYHAGSGSQIRIGSDGGSFNDTRLVEYVGSITLPL